ncbi:hypothetical protein GCM10023107_61690 [Actinoplanes octamycinicus]
MGQNPVLGTGDRVTDCGQREDPAGPGNGYVRRLGECPVWPAPANTGRRRPPDRVPTRPRPGGRPISIGSLGCGTGLLLTTYLRAFRFFCRERFHGYDAFELIALDVRTPGRRNPGGPEEGT